MVTTLPLSEIVNVVVEITPSATARSGFNVGLIIGTSNRITTADRVVEFTGLSTMLDYGFEVTDSEYLAATLYFGQTKRPNKVAVGRWDNSGETLTAALAACRSKNAEWYGVLLCGATNQQIRDIAAYIEAMEPAGVHFYTTNDVNCYNSTDPLAAGYITSGGTPDTDISDTTDPTFKIAVDGDTVPNPPDYKSITLTPTGLDTGAEIAAALQEAIRNEGGIYASVTVSYVGGVYIITSGTTGITSKVRITAGDANDVAAALKITTGAGAVETDGTGTIMQILKASEYSRSIGQFSTYADAAAAIMGYAMGANTGLLNSMYTLAYKKEVGITVEALTGAQVSTIKGKNGNVYINRGNRYNVFEQGIMANGQHFDEVLGLDQLCNDIQIGILDLLTGTNKVPQTEPGMTQLYNAISKACGDSRTRVFIAPGVWTGPDILGLETGDMLSQGYTILSEGIDAQSAADRSLRKAPPIYVPVKLAGAIESVVIQVNVNQ